MAQIAKENGDQPAPKNKDGESDDEYSFYSEDSYEYLPRNPDITMLRYCRPSYVPALNLGELPDYESTSDEEEAEEK